MYIFLCVVSNIKLSAVFRYCRENRVADRCVVYFARGEDIGFRWFRLQLEVERWREREKERETYLPTYLQFDRWIFHTVLAGLMCSYKSINMFTAYVGRLQVAIATGALGDLLPLQRCTADQLR